MEAQDSLIETINGFGKTYLSFFIEQNTWTFLILTVIMAGGAAYMAGRALALGWKSVWLLVVYMLIFGLGVRFLHFALFQAELTSLKYYVSHTLILEAIALFGHRISMAQQMVSKYPFAYQRNGLLGWKTKS